MAFFEVELKAPIADPTVLTAQVEQLGAEPAGIHEEEDVYFAHPVRDFAKTDEAVRVRRKGDAAWITYKGPKVDATTKTRREIEVPLAGVDVWGAAIDLLESLGFRKVRVVRKERRTFEVDWEGWPVLISIDFVQGLGDFVELETHAEEDRVKEARDALLRLAATLGLRKTERRSYLELLLEVDRVAKAEGAQNGE